MASFKHTIVHAAAAVAFAVGVPAYTWQSGHFTGVITDTGVGDIDLIFNANDNIDAATQCSALITPRGAVANWPRQVFTNIVHTTNITKQILISQEGTAGGASAAADINFDIVFVFANWPRQVYLSCVHTADIAKQILISEEAAAAGGASVAVLKMNIL